MKDEQNPYPPKTMLASHWEFEQSIRRLGIALERDWKRKAQGVRKVVAALRTMARD